MIQSHRNTFQLESKVTLYLNNINILSNFQTDKQINPNCLVDFLKLFTEQKKESVIANCLFFKEKAGICNCQVLASSHAVLTLLSSFFRVSMNDSNSLSKSSCSGTFLLVSSYDVTWICGDSMVVMATRHSLKMELRSKIFSARL